MVRAGRGEQGVSGRNRGWCTPESPEASPGRLAEARSATTSSRRTSAESRLSNFKPKFLLRIEQHFFSLE
jgi:hypothetical protein